MTDLEINNVSTTKIDGDAMLYECGDICALVIQNSRGYDVIFWYGTKRVKFHYHTAAELITELVAYFDEHGV